MEELALFVRKRNELFEQLKYIDNLIEKTIESAKTALITKLIALSETAKYQGVNYLGLPVVYYFGGDVSVNFAFKKSLRTNGDVDIEVEFEVYTRITKEDPVRFDTFEEVAEALIRYQKEKYNE